MNFILAGGYMNILKDPALHIADNSLASWNPTFLGVLRIVCSCLFLQHGIGKLFNWTTVLSFTPINLISSTALSGLIELIAGTLLMLGLFTRPMALILALDMLVTYFIINFQHNMNPLLNNGELMLLYGLIFLYFSIVGSGKWALDNALYRFNHPKFPPPPDAALS
jgi:putative oxidoreductase